MNFYEFENYVLNIEKSFRMQDKYREIMTEGFLDSMAGHLIDDIVELLEE